MNDPLEEILSQVTPRGAPAELRGDTLAGTRDTLVARPPRRWDVWCGTAAAAALLLGIGLQVLVIWADAAQFAQLYGPEPLPRHIAETADSIESVTNPGTGHWVREQWRIARASRRQSAEDTIDRIRHHYQNILGELAAARKEPSHVEKGRQMDRDRPDGARGDPSDRFGRPYLHDQCTA